MQHLFVDTPPQFCLDGSQFSFERLEVLFFLYFVGAVTDHKELLETIVAY
jgi:hypothetical protein